MQPPSFELTSEYAESFAELVHPGRTTGVNEPQIVWLNESLAVELGLDLDWLHTEAGTRWLIGLGENASQPYAQVYAGHQFGHYSPRLGDGRALLLGELTDLRKSKYDLHLKGSGPTVFSRGGDGFAALGPMLREAAIGESLHALHIPTSRALAVTKTGRWLHRDDETKPAAILTRVAASHMRVGTFQYVRALGDIELLKRLSGYANKRHFGAEGNALSLLQNVIKVQASLTADFMLAGFVHGVMNTDNMTISGQALDFGPCAFIDSVGGQTLFSSIDAEGRYAYDQQPIITKFNLARFAETLLPLLGHSDGEALEVARAEIDHFDELYETARLQKLANKLGIKQPEENSSYSTLQKIDTQIFAEMRDHKIDLTGFFRKLLAVIEQVEGSTGDVATIAGRARLGELYGGGAPGGWFDEWLRLRPDVWVMGLADPLRIPRNNTLQSALDAAEVDDFMPFKNLIEAISNPFEERSEWRGYDSPEETTRSSFITTCGT